LARLVQRNQAVNHKRQLADADNRVVDNAAPGDDDVRSLGMMSSMTLKEKSGSAESHIERAMRGPTPDNPSQSLKKRLKRAAFLDKREREVAEGKAEPVDPAAGLPEAAVDEGFMLRPDSGSREAGRDATA
jgi:hypothetical protein